MSPYSRREFLKTELPLELLRASEPCPYTPPSPLRPMSSPWESRRQVTRLAFGTGSSNGHVQSALGQQQFSKLVAYAYERGIRFFETAESYTTPAMLGEALKPYPRESYVLMNKVTTDEGVDPHVRFDEMRASRRPNTSTSCCFTGSTPTAGSPKPPAGRTAFSNAAEEDDPLARSLGAWPARAAPDARQQVARSGHDPHEPQGHTDGRSHLRRQQQSRPCPRGGCAREAGKSDGMGVISMKLCGDGTFTQHSDRQAAMRFAFKNAGVDSVTVGSREAGKLTKPSTT